MLDRESFASSKEEIDVALLRMVLCYLRTFSRSYRSIARRLPVDARGEGPWSRTGKRTTRT